jgi:hypothetical protein
MSAGLTRELQIAGLLAGKIRPRIGRHGAFVCTGLSPRVISRPRTSITTGSPAPSRSSTTAIWNTDPPAITHPCSVHDEVDRRGHLAHMSDGQVDVRHQRHRLEMPERVTRRVGVGGRYPRPATASARSVSLARSPPCRGASGRGMPFFVLADVLEGETRPRDEVSYGLRDEDLRRPARILVGDAIEGRRARSDPPCTGSAPGVRSGPC